MPIIWRYLLGQFLKVTLLSIVAFVGILVVTRLEQIARFAALGGTWPYVLRFTFLQIPYLLPIVIPISCLIAAMILFSRLSANHELTAFRSSGLALRQILGPVLFAAALFTVLNFYVVSELATASHLATRQLERQVKSLNPLLLLQGKKSFRFYGAYMDVLGASKSADYAEDALVAYLNSGNDRLSLILANRVKIDDGTVVATDISVVSNMPRKETDLPDHVAVENLGLATSPISEYSRLTERRGWRLALDHLQMPLLIVATRSAVAMYRELKQLPKEEQQGLHATKRKIQDCFSEISRRVSLALAAFTYTLLGCAYGISISRHRSHRGLLSVILLAALYLGCFLVAKDLKGMFYTSTALYIGPHLLIAALSVRTLRQVSRGVE